jgi:hypothetical protein
VDVRENILVRLLSLADSQAPGRADRNVGSTSGLDLSFIVLDGDEVTREDNSTPRNSRGDPRIMQDFTVMTPTFLAILGAPSTDIGTLLNAVRAQVVPLVINDPELISYVGPGGELRYSGCSLNTDTVEKREGRLELNFRITYPLSINDLSTGG